MRRETVPSRRAMRLLYVRMDGRRGTRVFEGVEHGRKERRGRLYNAPGLGRDS
jgi:hypothetical protein